MPLYYSSRPSPGDILPIIFIQLIMLATVSHSFGFVGFIIYLIILIVFGFFIFSEKSSYSEEALKGLYIFTCVGFTIILPIILSMN